MTAKEAPAERKIAAIASASHGVVTRAQLLGAGVSIHEIAHRIHTGLLIRQHWGVYRVGHRAPSVEATYLAAVRAAGNGAVLSGRAAAYLQGLVKGRPPPAEVTTPVRRKTRGLTTRRCRQIARDATILRGIPITAVPRTLVDLAAELSLDDLARACHEAGVRYGTTPRHVDRVLARRPNVRGAGKLRRVIGGDVLVTLSKLERGFLRRLREAGLPLPETNRAVGGHRVDCRWPAYRLTVELNGYRYHNSRYAWERQRLREREARSRRDKFRTYTWADVFEDPSYMLAELRTLLAGSAPDR